jgi:hypothetical protein
MIIDAAPASALAATAVPIVTCMGAGSAVGCDNSRWPGADMLVGFGLLGAALTVLALATPIPLSGLMITLAALSMVALAIRRQIPGGRATWIALALASPILVRAASDQAALWDEFWHWLPSAAYAFRHSSLVKLGLPRPAPHGRAASPRCHHEPRARRRPRGAKGKHGLDPIKRSA